jgi:hypothetical protein
MGHPNGTLLLHLGNYKWHDETHGGGPVSRSRMMEMVGMA